MSKLRFREPKAALSLMAALCLSTSLAMAQVPTTEQVTSNSTASEPATQLEKVVVTGSNIPMAIDALAVPVTNIPTIDIQTSGAENDTLDLLRKLIPSVAGVGNENATISTNTNFGGSETSLHGLSVLVLVNGHRLANNSGAAVGGSSFTDLNMIPPSAIDHIDVLQDGSSAVYGSDAVGGVINVVLKKDFNGWEATAHYGISPTTGHYSERSFGLDGGVSNDKTSITFSANYSQSDPMFFSQRHNTQFYYANDYLPGVIDIYDLGYGTPEGIGQANPDEDYYLAPGINAPPAGGNYTIAQLVKMGIYIDGGNDATAGPAIAQKVGFNFASKQTLIQSLKSHSFSVNITHSIFGDALKAAADVEYSRTVTQSSLNAQPIYPYISEPYTDSWYNGGPPSAGTQYVLTSTPGNPFSTAFIQQQADDNSGAGIDVHNRFITYPRIYQNDSYQLNVNGSLFGKISENYSWEADGTVSRYDLSYTNPNVIDAANFYAALANGKLNPFAIVQAPGVLPGNILGTATMSSYDVLEQGSLVVNGTPFDLPAGQVAFAVGLSYLRDVLGATADQNTENHTWINSPTIKPINSSRNDLSVFAELEIPLVSKKMGITGIHTLNLDVAARMDDYQNVGTSRVPKISLKYAPINDELALRFSAGKSFVAPTLYSLYGPVNVGSSNDITYTPYKSSTSVGPVQFESASGANPELKPYTATTWSAGLQYSPKSSVLDGLGLSVDFFSTHESGIPGSVPQQTIVQSVENLGTASPYASLVHFNSENGPTPTAPGQISTRPLSSVWLVAPTINLGGALIRGADISAEYDLKTNHIGKFVFRSTASIYNTYQIDVVPSEAYYNYIGQTSINAGTIARYKTYTTIDWYYQGFQLNVSHTFVPSVNDVGTGGSTSSKPVSVNSYSQFDVNLAYSFDHLKVHSLAKYLDGLTIRVGCNNVFYAVPPLSLNANSETKADLGYYNGPVGPLLYTNVTYKF